MARYLQLKRLRAALPLRRRARNRLYRALNTTARAVCAVLPAARARERHARLGMELRERLFVPRRSRTRLQYYNLQGRYAAHSDVALRRRLVRRLRTKRLQKSAVTLFSRARRVRALPVRIARLRRANLRIRKTLRLLRGATCQIRAPRGAKL